MELKLEELRSDHLELVRIWRNSPSVSDYMYSSNYISSKDQKKWFQRVSKDDSKKYWMIYFNNDPIGVINLYDIDVIHKKAKWAYYIGDNNYRGKGIARTLECNIYDYVFNTLKLNKLSCEVFKTNEKVISIHQKFGSRVEGEFRDHIKKNGFFYDVVSMGILDRDWQSIKHNYEYKKIRID